MLENIDELYHNCSKRVSTIVTVDQYTLNTDVLDRTSQISSNIIVQ